MNCIGKESLRSMILAAAEEIVAHEPELTRLDRLIGDGDHGYGMKEGFSQLIQLLNSRTFSSIYDLMRQVGMTLVRTMGGASGVIFGTLFTGGHTLLRGKEEMSVQDFIAFFETSAVVISQRGRCKAGDKTMLDSLLSAIQAMQDKKACNDFGELLEAAQEGALRGMEATKDMMSKIGRSKNFREKTLGLIDPGARSMAYIFEGFYKGYRQSLSH